MVPRATYERDPTIDYRIHKAALHTMATCHSLREVDGKILGDPLDVKMFEFTGWSFEESSQLPDAATKSEAIGVPLLIARPPTSMKYNIDDTCDIVVCVFSCWIISSISIAKFHF